MSNHPKVIFEDNHLLIVDKPAGFLVQGDRTGDQTITDWGQAYIKDKYNKPGAVFLHPAHRLDRPVSGLVILARTSKSLERMNKLFREDQITKTYLAIVENKPEIEKHTLIHWIEKDDQKNRSRAYSKAKGKAKRSELSYELIAIQKDKALCLVEPKTGRPHQIRVQLAKIGSPIQGDLKYGATQPNPDKSISLHAYKLSFVHPVRKQLLEVKASPPGPEWKPYLNWINELD